MSALDKMRALAALRGFGAQLRQDRARRRRLHVRTAWLATLGVAIGTTIVAPPAPCLVWNASASSPRGAYWVTRGGVPNVGDHVIAWAPEPWRQLAARRHYLPANVPLVKRVAAVPGMQVCAAKLRILVDGHAVAVRRARDGRGRVMPWWNGCRTLRPSEYFLLIAGGSASFDGRYFGVTDAQSIIGTARLIWRVAP